jgi:hypothetical protein
MPANRVTIRAERWPGECGGAVRRASMWVSEWVAPAIGAWRVRGCDVGLRAGCLVASADTGSEAGTLALWVNEEGDAVLRLLTQDHFSERDAVAAHGKFV